MMNFKIGDKVEYHTNEGKIGGVVKVIPDSHGFCEVGLGDHTITAHVDNLSPIADFVKGDMVIKISDGEVRIIRGGPDRHGFYPTSVPGKKQEIWCLGSSLKKVEEKGMEKFHIVQFGIILRTAIK